VKSNHKQLKEKMMKNVVLAFLLLVIVVISASADSPWMNTNNADFQFQERGRTLYLRNTSTNGAQVDYVIWFTPANFTNNPFRANIYVPAEKDVQIYSYVGCAETGDRKCIDRVDVHLAKK
jgi:hypothetical protein